MKPQPPRGGDLTRLLSPLRRSIRLPFVLLLLLAVAAALSCTSAVRRSSLPEIASAPQLPPPWNATWLRLAAGDVTAPDGEAEVEELLADGGHGRRSMSIWRRLRRGRTASQAMELRLLPEVRKVLREWGRWRRYDATVMQELAGLVKGPMDRQRGVENASARFGSCAVVGNSGILLNNEYGELIDSHELVIRLNNARIHGYQRHVGSKTGLAFVNSNILHLCSRRPGCFCHPYGQEVPLVMYICQAIHFLDYIICNASHKSPLLVMDARFDILCARIVKYYSLKRFVHETGKAPQEWNKSHDAKMFHYSSGMQAVMLAVGICDKVSIFGFGKSGKFKHHYHTNQKKELDLHDYEAEYLLYHDLIEQPEAIPFLADSRFKIPPVVLYL